MNHHGNNAVSVTGQTRYFYPVGHGIKINHYFPGKNYQYQNLERPENTNDSRPVHEEKEPTVINEEPKVMVVDSGDQVMLVQQDEVKDVAPSPTPEVVEAVQVIPALVQVIPPNPENDKVDNEIPLPVEEKTEVLPSNDLPSTPEEQTAEVKDQAAEKEDQNQDSEVASSFYHSRFYYVGF